MFFLNRAVCHKAHAEKAFIQEIQGCRNRAAVPKGKRFFMIFHRKSIGMEGGVRQFLYVILSGNEKNCTAY